MGDHKALAVYRDLGRMLRRVRKEAGLTETELARRVDWPLLMISRMENGRRVSATTDVIVYLVGCGMKSQAAQPLVEFTRQAELKQGYYLSDARIGGHLQSLIFHESSAKCSIIYQPHVIHGLLQTPDYAHAIITAHNSLAEDGVAGAVRTRMERQRILSVSNAGRFTFYIDEHALRLRVGSDSIMHEQLLHLVLMAALDNVTVRIVPSAAGERSVFGGAFHLMEFHEHRPIVSVDQVRSGLILEDPHHVNGYRDLRPRLADVAMDRGRSREFATDLADAHDRGIQRSVAVVQARARLPQRMRGGGVVESPTPIYE